MHLCNECRLRVMMMLIPRLKTYADEVGIPFKETSAKNATNVEEVFITMAANMKNCMPAALPTEKGAGINIGNGTSTPVRASGAKSCC